MVLDPDIQEKEAPKEGFSQKPARICLLVETGGEFGPTQIHKPFSFLELR